MKPTYSTIRWIRTFC